jgi:hypothetical protein
MARAVFQVFETMVDMYHVYWILLVVLLRRLSAESVDGQSGGVRGFGYFIVHVLQSYIQTETPISMTVYTSRNLTDSMEKNSSWEANSSSASQ